MFSLIQFTISFQRNREPSLKFLNKVKKAEAISAFEKKKNENGPHPGAVTRRLNGLHIKRSLRCSNIGLFSLVSSQCAAISLIMSRLKHDLLIIKERLRFRANMFKHLCSRHAPATRLSAGAERMPRL